MEGHTSKKTMEASFSAAGGLQRTIDLSSDEYAFEFDAYLPTFDTTLQDRTSHAINTLVDGLEVRALSFESLKEATECILKMNQEVTTVILEYKEDILKNKELLELVKEYFNIILQTPDFFDALKKCLKRARDSQSLIVNALGKFDEETKIGESRYDRTLEELRNFRAAGDLFTEEFFLMFRSVYNQQIQMLGKLPLRMNEVDKNLECINVWRKVSSMIFATTLAAISISSVVEAAAGASECVTAALVALTSPIRSMGKWIDSLCENYENALKRQREVISSMQKVARSMEAGTRVAIKDLDNIQELIKQLVDNSAAPLPNTDFAVKGEPVKIAMEEMEEKLEVFIKDVEELKDRLTSAAKTVILNLPELRGWK